MFPWQQEWLIMLLYDLILSLRLNGLMAFHLRVDNTLHEVGKKSIMPFSIHFSVILMIC